MSTYRFGDVLRYTGATRSQLIHWTDVGLIRAGVEDTAGTGHHRRFGFHDLVETRVAVFLAKYRMPVPSIAFVITQVRKSIRRRTVEGRKDVLYVPESLSARQVWMGSVEEFQRELVRPVFLDARAGLVINLAGIVEDLNAATARDGAS